MELQNTTEDEMASSFCLFKIKPFSLMIASALVLSLVFYASFFGFGFSSILFTSLVLFVSTLLFTFTKQKPVIDHQETLNSDHETISIQQPAESEAVVNPHDHEEQELEADDDEQQIHDYSIKLSSSQDFLPEGDQSLNHLSSSEESEVDWPFREIVYQISPDCSDGSISDEDSDLIEISLPSGHYVGNYNKDQEAPKFHFSTPSINLKQHGLMELVAAEISDMNEEDNLIEIDISMGSIKCSRFEIEA